MRSFHAVLLAAFLLPRLGAAQAKSQPAAQPSDETEQTGLIGFVQVQGNSTPLGLVTSAVADVGYQLTPHLTAEIGLPVFLTRNPFSLVTTHDWRWFALFGDPYIDVRYTTTLSGTNITSILTGTIPISNTRRVFTTGRFGADWFNHIDRDFKGLTPFLNLGVANGTVDRYVLPRPYSISRPYRTLGVISDFEGGVSYRIHGVYRLGASGYALLPVGPQKVFSRLVAPDSPIAGDGQHDRYFDSAFETIASSRIARDSGFSGWLELTRLHNVTVQIGYTKSMHYRLDSVTLMINFSATPLMRGATE